ncbi:MAG: hypothetical protein Q9216_005220 [Gyalolechia sp. 2 TL-2023]
MPVALSPSYSPPKPPRPTTRPLSQPTAKTTWPSIPATTWRKLIALASPAPEVENQCPERSNTSCIVQMGCSCPDPDSDGIRRPAVATTFCRTACLRFMATKHRRKGTGNAADRDPGRGSKSLSCPQKSNTVTPYLQLPRPGAVTSPPSSFFHRCCPFTFRSTITTRCGSGHPPPASCSRHEGSLINLPPPPTDVLAPDSKSTTPFTRYKTQSRLSSVCATIVLSPGIRYSWDDHNTRLPSGRPCHG